VPPLLNNTLAGSVPKPDILYSTAARPLLPSYKRKKKEKKKKKARGLAAYISPARAISLYLYIFFFFHIHKYFLPHPRNDF